MWSVDETSVTNRLSLSVLYTSSSSPVHVSVNALHEKVCRNTNSHLRANLTRYSSASVEELIFARGKLRVLFDGRPVCPLLECITRTTRAVEMRRHRGRLMRFQVGHRYVYE